MFAALGRSALDLLLSELEELGEELGRSGRRLLRVVVAFAAAGGVLFWACGVSVFLAIALLSLIWPLWGAALGVLGGLLLLALVAGGLGYLWLRGLEQPLETVRRRWNDHLDWWRDEIVDAGVKGGASPADGTPSELEPPKGS